MAKKTWNEFFFGTEEDRKRAREVLKEMRPDYQRPGEAEKRKAAGTYTKPYDPKRKASGTYTKPYDVKRKAAGTYTSPYDKKAGAVVTSENKEDKKLTLRKAVKKAPKSNFKGNWVGAAPTEMQKRGGARIKKKATLMGLLKKKRSS